MYYINPVIKKKKTCNTANHINETIVPDGHMADKSIRDLSYFSDDNR